ncbi:molybdopterin molybdotransferase MoeA [Zhihengliuella sp.]|uniref:molybdopterin molybdotransferase MoeA n=1 Tax=Zhihengliuella sp. TaxID=1954483 RepID=UPI0028114D18|nr:molybdopterin molybdotransferase MoeA [Zhihengliuella sp.]
MGGSPWPAARAAAYRAGTELAATLGDARSGRPRSTWVPVRECVGSVCAEDVRAPMDLPHFVSSAMDGWAVAGPPPWRLVPGGPPRRPTPLETGTAAPVLTGAPLPAGTTAVLRSERGEAADGLLRATEAVPDGADIRPAGREASRGDLLVPAGTRLTPAHAAAASVAGIDAVRAAVAPRVRLVLTGDEVVEAGIPEPGYVRDAFQPLLPAAVAGLGGDVREVVRIGDDRRRTDEEVAADADVVILTGGTGRSAADHVRAALEAMGAELVVDQIDMRPGHPAVLARRNDGALLVALPGNPLAAVAALLTLAGPALAGATGRPEEPPRWAAAAEPHAPLPGRHRLIPAALADDATGRLLSCDRTGPGMMRGLAGADALMIVPPGGVEDGDPVEFLPLPWSTR